MPWRETAVALRRIGIVNVVVLAAFAGVSSSAFSDRLVGKSTCADLVRYHGTLYEGTFVGRPMRGGQRIRAVRPACADGPGGTQKDIGTRLAQIRGVAPSLALLADDEPRHVYLVAGVFPENPNHPLHIVLYGARQRPNDCQGTVVGSVRVRGTVGETPLPFNLLSVRSTTGSKSLIVDAWTHLGYAFTRPLVKGDRVQVVARRCRAPNTTQAVLVARSLSLR